MMTTVVSLLLFAVFGFLSGIHFYWGLGGKRGFEAAVPTGPNQEKVMAPSTWACFVVGFGLLCFGIFALISAHLIPVHLPGRLSDAGLGIIAAIFILRATGEFNYVGFFKKIKTTRFGKMDTKYYSPLCLTIGILCILLAWAT